MKQTFLTALAGLSAMALAPAAHATAFIPGDKNFQTTVGSDGSISAFIGDSGLAKGTGSDTFNFFVGQNGIGSGGVQTSTGTFHSRTDLDLLSVFINGVAATRVGSADSLYEAFNLTGIQLLAGVQNVITVNYKSRGNGSYGGNITFVPSVPEAATWAMMLIGFGATGVAMRYRRREAKVSYA